MTKFNVHSSTFVLLLLQCRNHNRITETAHICVSFYRVSVLSSHGKKQLGKLPNRFESDCWNKDHKSVSSLSVLAKSLSRREGDWFQWVPVKCKTEILCCFHLNKNWNIFQPLSFGRLLYSHETWMSEFDSLLWSVILNVFMLLLCWFLNTNNRKTKVHLIHKTFKCQV